MTLKGLHGGQLPMFMGATDLQNTITKSYDTARLYDTGETHENGMPKGRDESLPELWDRKAEESRAPLGTGDPGAGVYDSMSKSGYRGKVGIPVGGIGTDGPKLVADGHHRVASGAAIEKETGKNVWIPLDHLDHREMP